MVYALPGGYAHGCLIWTHAQTFAGLLAGRSWGLQVDGGGGKMAWRIYVDTNPDT